MWVAANNGIKRTPTAAGFIEVDIAELSCRTLSVVERAAYAGAVGRPNGHREHCKRALGAVQK